MMKKFKTRIIVIILSSFVHILFPNNNPALSLEKKITLSDQTITCVVNYHKGKEDWAKYIITMTDMYLKTVEQYMGTALAKKDTFNINGKELEMLNGIHVGGTNLWDNINIEYQISEVGNPGVLFHELNHYWFNTNEKYWAPSGDFVWLAEGVCSFLPIAMVKSGHLTITDDAYAYIMKHWGLNYPDYEKDLPVLHDFRNDKDAKRNFFYAKTFKLQYILFNTLGADNYQRFLTGLFKGTLPKNIDDVIDLLQNLKKQNWREFLSGWLFPGKYKVIHYKDFADRDSDGILSVDEYFSKTDPGKVDTDGDSLPDGVELSYGLNPLKKDSKATVKQITDQHGPFTDGVFTDWQDLPRVILTEKQGDSTLSSLDMSLLSYTLKDDYFHLYVKTDAPPLQAENIMFDMLVDFDGDRQQNKEVAFFTAKPDHPWIFLSAEKDSIRPNTLHAGVNNGVEFAVPIDALQERFFFQVLARDHAKNINHDYWDYWVEVRLDRLKFIREHNLQTDLHTQDHDNDGIPDAAEFTHGLDPKKADSPAVIKKYGPFIDGNHLDWQSLDTAITIEHTKKTKNAAFNFTRLSYRVTQDYLYLMAETRAKPVVKQDVMFDILVDVKGDKKINYEFAFFLHNPSGPWKHTRALKQSTPLASIDSAMGTVFEMAIPLEEIKAKVFYIRPLLWDNKNRKELDAFTGWVTITTR